MNPKQDIYSIIREIIHDEVLYLRHYIGEVVDDQDDLNKGRVKITIPDIGHYTNDTALWCYPRQGAGMSIPKVGSYAEIYFIAGDPTRPVYLYPASEVVDNIPQNYDGNTDTNILFEDYNDKANNIKFDRSTGELIIYDGEDYAVKYNELETAFNQLKDDFDNFVTLTYNVHQHPTAAVGAPSNPSVTGSSSTADVSPAKVEKVRLP